MLENVIDSRRRDLGGFTVGRVLPSVQRRMLGPFIFFDHMGPVTFAAGMPRSVDVRPHPHIGLSTVTYLFDGEIMHRDSVGSTQSILPGEVNWMVAGSGITHSERFEKARAQGGNLHGIQAWVALPLEHEDTAPSFVHHPQSDLPVWQAPGVWARVIAGEAFGLRANVHTHSPLFYLHCVLDPGARFQLPRFAQRGVFIVSGRLEVGGHAYAPGQLLTFDAGHAEVSALEPSCVMALGGEPIGQRFIEWNFVASSLDRIEQAKLDWREGRMKLPDLDHDEFVPLPGA